MMEKNNPDINTEGVGFIKLITAAGSVHLVDVEFLSPIRCIQRRNNRRCKGVIKITPRTNVIEWQCTKCESSGVITEWRGSDSDMSKYAIHLATASALSLDISLDEYVALRKVFVYSREIEAIMAGAVWDEDEDAVMLTGSYNAFDELVGNLAFEINHSRSTKNQLVLNDVCDSIEMLLQRSNRG